MSAVSEDVDLFQAEEAALASAMRVFNRADADADACRAALGELIVRYQRTMRETRRMIRHGDRQERELTVLNARLKELAHQLDHKARHDPLTGELNRGAIIELGNQLLLRGPLSLVVLDIDHFKAINDTFGHPVGDAVIIELVARVRGALPDGSSIGRVGGEEFTVVLPHYALPDAVVIAQGMRTAISRRAFSKVADRSVTASFGVSWNAQGSSFDEAYARADAALYEAKRSGRNNVIEAS